MSDQQPAAAGVGEGLYNNEVLYDNLGADPTYVNVAEVPVPFLFTFGCRTDPFLC